MYYFETIKPKLIALVGAHPQYGHSTIHNGISNFVERLNTQRVYTDIGKNQRQALSGHLHTLQGFLDKEATWIATHTPLTLRNIFRKNHALIAHDATHPQTPSNGIEFNTLYDIINAIALRQKPEEFPNLYSALTHRPISTLRKALAPIYTAADTLDEDYKSELVKNTYLPPKGPLDIRELISFLDLFHLALKTKRYQELHTAGRRNPQFSLFDRIGAELGFLLRELRQQASDIELEQDRFQMNDDHVQDFLRTIAFNPEHIIALTRYYTEHHKERLTKIQYSSLDRQISRIFFQCCLLQTKSYSDKALAEAKAAQKRHRPLWVTLDKPSIENTLEKIQAAATQTKKQKHHVENFLRIREKIPAGMEEVVTLYYPEKEGTKKARNASFKNKYYGDSLGAKRHFVRALAATQAQNLQKYYNATVADIEQMCFQHTLPEHLGLSIDHITDRKFGGTNLSENLMAIPAEINAQKEKMIAAQISALGPQTDPTWIITWHPKRDRFDSFPDLYIPKTIRDTPEITPYTLDTSCDAQKVPVFNII